MKLQIELNDTLQERVDSAIKDVKTKLRDYLKANPDTDNLPCLSNDLDYSGAIHEIIDSSVPIYPHEIRTIMFLHGMDVESAFDDAGIGGRDSAWPNGWEAAAIYCYIKEKVREWWYEEAQDIFDEWKVKQDEKLNAQS